MSDRPGTDGALAEAWSEQRLWSRTADRLKASVDRARAAGLALGVAGAVLGVLAVQLSEGDDLVGRILGGLAGLAVGGAAFTGRWTGTPAITRWTRARSVSEGLKTEVHRYLVGVGRYAGGDREAALRRRCREVLTAASDLRPHTLGVERDDKALPEVHDAESYCTHRVDEQIERYYRPKARAYRRRVTRLRRGEAALGVVGLVLAALAGAGQVEATGLWIPVVTTVGAALLAHLSAARYEHQVVEFLRTAEQLAFLRADWRAGDRSDAAFVEACEDTISVENQAWMARWLKDRPEGQGGMAGAG